jgi:hypothetical protein
MGSTDSTGTSAMHEPTLTSANVATHSTTAAADDMSFALSTEHTSESSQPNWANEALQRNTTSRRLFSALVSNEDQKLKSQKEKNETFDGACCAKHIFFLRSQMPDPADNINTGYKTDGNQNEDELCCNERIIGLLKTKVCAASLS